VIVIRAPLFWTLKYILHKIKVFTAKPLMLTASPQKDRTHFFDLLKFFNALANASALVIRIRYAYFWFRFARMPRKTAHRMQLRRINRPAKTASRIFINRLTTLRSDHMSTHEHKRHAPRSVAIGIVTVSTTRTLADDQSGHWIAAQAQAQGHKVIYHEVITDETGMITRTVNKLVADSDVQVVILTGGTGISARDVTIEAVRPLMAKELVAFAPLFAQLSYNQVASAALISRATAGVIDTTVVFCLPGSLKACQLACKELIFPELGHLMHHVLKG